MKEPASATMLLAAIDLERDAFLQRVFDVQSRTLSLFTKTCHDGWHARTGRNISDLFPRKHVSDNAHQHYTFGIHRPFDKTTSDAIKQVFAGWTRMSS